MRILLAQESFLPAQGGAELHVYYLAREFKRMGHEVTVLTATPGADVVDGIDVVRMPMLARQGRASGIVSRIEGARITGLVKRHDLCHGHHTAMVSALVGRAAEAVDVPFVVSLHGFGTLDSSVQGNRHAEAWRSEAFERADAVVATAPEMREIAERFVRSDIIFDVENGVDTAAFAPAARPVPDLIMTTRRLVPKNGVQYLVEAAPLIVDRIPEARFEFVGMGPLGPALEARCRELGIADRVHFAGDVPHGELPAHVARASVVVFPSSAEGFSLSCLEAMSVGRPVVASAVGAFPVMLADGRGSLVKLFDREGSDYNAPELPAERVCALAEAVVHALTDPVAQDRALAAQAWVRENYDWQAICRRLHAVYDAASTTHREN